MTIHIPFEGRMRECAHRGECAHLHAEAPAQRWIAPVRAGPRTSHRVAKVQERRQHVEGQAGQLERELI
jgi:hypothetical protein